MPRYVTKALQRFKHELTKIQNQPYPHVPPNYGAKFQFAKDIDTKLVYCPTIVEAIADDFELPSVKKIAYYHAECGYPIQSTWNKAIKKGNFSTWPGLNAKAAKKYYPEVNATMEGHMNDIHQGIKSTQPKDKQPLPTTPSVPQEPLQKEHDVFFKIIDLKETVYTYQTGKFTYLSSKGNRYIMVAIHVDANYIFMEAMMNRTEAQMIEAYDRIVRRIKLPGLGLKKHILDNEASANIKEKIQGHGMLYRLVPPGKHRSNIAERETKTAKNHFVSVLCGAQDDLTMHLWCQLLPRSECQINML